MLNIASFKLLWPPWLTSQGVKNTSSGGNVVVISYPRVVVALVDVSVGLTTYDPDFSSGSGIVFLKAMCNQVWFLLLHFYGFTVLILRSRFTHSPSGGGV